MRQTLEVTRQFGDVGGEDNSGTTSAAVGVRDLDAIDVCFGDERVSAEDVSDLSSELIRGTGYWGMHTHFVRAHIFASPSEGVT